MAKQDIKENQKQSAPKNKVQPPKNSNHPAKKPGQAAAPLSAGNKKNGTQAAGAAKQPAPKWPSAAQKNAQVPPGNKNAAAVNPQKKPEEKPELESKGTNGSYKLAEGFKGKEKKWDSRDAEKKQQAEKKKKEERHKKKLEQKEKKKQANAERAKKKAEKKKENQNKEMDKLSPKEKKQVERSKKKGVQKEQEKKKKEAQKERTQQNKDKKRLEEQMKQKPQTKEQKQLQKDYMKEQKQKEKDKKKKDKDLKKKEKEDKKKSEDKKEVDFTIYEKELAKGDIPWIKETEGKTFETEKPVAFGGVNKDGKSKGELAGKLELNKVDSEYVAKASLGKDGVKAEAGFEAGYYAARGEGSASYEIVDGVKAHAEASGYVGAVAEGNASANFTIDKNGINAGLDAEIGAYAAKGEISGGFNIFGVDIGLKAEGKVGAGAEAGIGFEDGKFYANLGATLGIGGSVGVEIDFSEAIDNVSNFIDENSEKIGDAVEAVGDTIGDAVDAVGDTIGGAVDTVKGWFGW